MADLLTTRQVQEILQVDRTTIYRMVDAGQLPAVRVGKQWRFARAEIESWLRTQMAPAAPGASGTRSGGATSANEAGDATPAAYGLRSSLPLACTQMIQDAFADALGVMIVVTDMDGQPVTEISNPCGLFEATMRDLDGIAGCVRHWQEMAGNLVLEPKFAPSLMGLLCARGLIRSGNELQGMVFVGGIAPDNWPPSPESRALLAQQFGLSAERFEANMENVYRMDRATRERVLQFVQRIADIMSHIMEDHNALAGRLKAIASLTSL